MKRASERPYQRAERGRVGVASIVERASETMLIRLLKIDWPVGFAAAAEREREASICFRGINRRGGHPSNGIRGWESKVDRRTRTDGRTDAW